MEFSSGVGTHLGGWALNRFYPDDSQWLLWVVDVQVVDEARERDTEEVRPLPQAAHLLISNLLPHTELPVGITYTSEYTGMTTLYQITMHTLLLT